MAVTVWFDLDDMKTKVRTGAGVLLDETGETADIAPQRRDPSIRWSNSHEAATHFQRVDAILRRL